MNTDTTFSPPFFWGNCLITLGNINIIADVNVAKYGSDICLGEQISLGKCVRGHSFPGGTHITVTPVLQARIGQVFLLYFVLDEVWELAAKTTRK